MTRSNQILANLVAALLIALLVAYAAHLANQLTESMIQDRVVHANFFSKLVKENWDGIKSYSNDEKKALLDSLDPAALGTDIRMLRVVILFLLFGFGASVLLGRAAVIISLWRGSHARVPEP